MCRLLIATKNALKVYNQVHGLTLLLAHLEKQCGGHGNGIALIKNKTVTFTRKGVKYTTEEATNALLTMKYDFGIFHTRIASVSTISDANCHPFTFQKRDVMAMNGTISGISGIASALGITDTELIFNSVKGATLSTTIKALQTLSPVFVGSVAGLPYALKNNGELVSWTHKRLKKNDYLFVSSVPNGVVYKPLPTNFTWINGCDKTPEALKTAISYVKPTGYYSSWDEYFKEDETLQYENLYEKGFNDGYECGWQDGLYDYNKDNPL